jgi:uncharacterized protein YggE
MTVTGTATLRVPPDRVSFSVGVDTVAATASQAFKANAAKHKAVVAALKAKGVDAKEIQTSNLEISSRDQEGKKLPGFRVSNVVTVTREDPSSVGDLLQAAVTAGANQASGLRFFVADPGGFQGRGLDMAFQAARRKAEMLATASKRSIGDVICVSEAAGGSRNVMENLASLGYAASSVQIGTEQVNFGVVVVFELR